MALSHLKLVYWYNMKPGRRSNKQDAVEAHSGIDNSTDKRLLSKTQLIDKLTAGCFDLKVLSTVYRMYCMQLTKTFGPKRPAANYQSVVCLAQESLISE